MKNICNWFFGSFFKTLGRVLVYLFVGYLISMLLQGTKILPDDFSFLFTNVKAYDEWPSADKITVTVDNQTLTTTNRIYTSAGNDKFKISSNELFTLNYTGNQIKYGYLSVCAAGSFDLTTYSSGSFSKNVKFYMTDIPCKIYNSGTTYPNSSVLYITFDLNLGPSGTNSAYYMCQTGSSSTLCHLDNEFTVNAPSMEWTLNSFGFGTEPIVFDQSQSALISQNKVIIDKQNQLINKADLQISAINSQTQAIQNQTSAIDNQTATIKDDSIDESSANTLVSGLQSDYTSLTPFSDFLNLPLTWIQHLLASSQVCTAIELPLPYLNNRTLTLPCMTEFWESMGLLGTLVQLVWIAVVGVRIFNGLFLLTCQTLDPNPDIDMTKIRTWEL